MEMRSEIPNLGLLHELPVLFANPVSKLHRTCFDLSSHKSREIGRVFEADSYPISAMVSSEWSRRRLASKRRRLESVRLPLSPFLVAEIRSSGWA